MSVDKLVDSTQLDADLTSVANAIRTKGGTSASLAFPADFVSAIAAIPSGGSGVYEDVVKGTATSFSSDITSVAPNLFRNNTVIREINLPNVTFFYSECARGASNLESISLPSVANIGGNAFMQCPKLTTPLVFPSLNSGALNGLSNITNVPAIDMLGGFRLNAYFQNNSNMVILILRASVLSDLANINNFNNTPFASGKAGGTLYVPSALVSSYQSATNWSTILGYPNNQIKSIESTHTDPNAPIDLTLYYADGTPIA